MGSYFFSVRLVLPPVEAVHQVLTAYLRTSELGEWRPNPERESDGFVMHFVRGNWGKSRRGRTVHKEPHWDSSGRMIPHTAPTQLEVSVRPSPQDAAVLLEFEFFAQVQSWLFEDKWGQNRYVRHWDAIVREEVAGLREYLKKCYELPDLPLIAE